MFVWLIYLPGMEDGAETEQEPGERMDMSI